MRIHADQIESTLLQFDRMAHKLAARYQHGEQDHWDLYQEGMMYLHRELVRTAEKEIECENIGALARTVMSRAMVRYYTNKCRGRPHNHANIDDVMHVLPAVDGGDDAVFDFVFTDAFFSEFEALHGREARLVAESIVDPAFELRLFVACKQHEQQEGEAPRRYAERMCRAALGVLVTNADIREFFGVSSHVFNQKYMKAFRTFTQQWVSLKEAA